MNYVVKTLLNHKDRYSAFYHKQVLSRYDKFTLKQNLQANIE